MRVGHEKRCTEPWFGHREDFILVEHLKRGTGADAYGEERIMSVFGYEL